MGGGGNGLVALEAVGSIMSISGLRQASCSGQPHWHAWTDINAYCFSVGAHRLDQEVGREN